MVVTRVGGQLHVRLADLFRGERRSQALEEGGHVPLPGGAGGDAVRAEIGGRGEFLQHRDESGAERVLSGFAGGAGGYELDRGLASGVTAAERRTAQRGSAGERDHYAAGIERAQQRFAGSRAGSCRGWACRRSMPST